jgi:hypothetical protein
VTAAEARQGEGQKGRKRLGQQPSHVTSGSARYKLHWRLLRCFSRLSSSTPTTRAVHVTVIDRLNSQHLERPPIQSCRWDASKRMSRAPAEGHQLGTHKPVLQSQCAFLSGQFVAYFHLGSPSAPPEFTTWHLICGGICQKVNDAWRHSLCSPTYRMPTVLLTSHRTLTRTIEVVQYVTHCPRLKLVSKGRSRCGACKGEDCNNALYGDRGRFC